ncbi:hypothetical protein BDD43_3043 [Mucilaginibacter gracilis]|uniref:Uncharacterized protein n=1 Tax=Mucilaginibacter gracilis TaxID=423350 RepID=A0A495J2C6_9SPHI|nr:hypothetical protein [Mucilaginibacter gracilis]RKR82852.1 hypothetical protein BDD43_3043 [Mucilaginibacter gracilis]
MSRIQGLNKFNERIGSLKRETLNRVQNIHERKLTNNKAYRISKQAKQFENLLHDINNTVEAVERIKPAGARWDIKFGELVLIDAESDEKILQ